MRPPRTRFPVKSMTIWTMTAAAILATVSPEQSALGSAPRSDEPTKASGKAPPADDKGTVRVEAAAAPKEDDSSTEPAAPAAAPVVKTPARLPALREGSMLVRSVGHIERDPTRNYRLFVPDVSGTDAPRRRFPIMPSGRLEDIERVLEATGADTVFEITGELFVYRGENYLLPGLAIPVESRASAPVEAAAPGGGVAEDIEARLRERVGPVARSSDLGPTMVGADTGALVPADSRLRLRRGTVMRNNDTGGWRVVLDADAGAPADPPMELLPCLLLESIERHARTTDGPAPILVSGRVVVYGGRNYLVPTAFQIPRTGRTLSPGLAVGGR
ncbi:MAG: hypothetical protein KDA22_13065 [Phycisphaerales bacterium]|nr:hypothetical protein [Phycisphaerales bacterium]